MDPLREEDQQAGTAEDVRVAVKRDVQVFLTRVLDQAQQLVGTGSADPLIEVGDVDAIPLWRPISIASLNGSSEASPRLWRTVGVVDAAELRGLPVSSINSSVEA